MANPFVRAAVAGGGGTAAVASGPSGGSGVSFADARSDVSAGMSGRISLAMLDTIILAMILFYIWTRNAQGGS